MNIWPFNRNPFGEFRSDKYRLKAVIWWCLSRVLIALFMAISTTATAIAASPVLRHLLGLSG